jgi:PAS domain S-box-containing protein
MDDQLKQFVSTTSAQLNLLMRAVESARNGIIVTDPNRPDNPIIYANPAFSELSGFRIEQILGRNCRFLQRDDRDQVAIDRIREAIRLAEPVTAVLRNYRKSGRIFWNELTVSPVFDDQGELINFVGIQNDVSARIESERRVSEFYSMISHELKTPLSSIHGALTSLLEIKVNAQSRKLLDIAVNNSAKLGRLIDDILDWKKLESGKFKLHLSEIDPDVLVTDVFDDFKESGKGRGLQFKKEIESERLIVADFDRLAQVLTNFISNAIKYSPPSGTITVRVRDTESDTTRFSVTDEGPGIPESQREYLFIHFQQLDSPDRRDKGGTGLGLAIAKAIIELHGGHIGVESEEGRGSTFWFEIFKPNKLLV